jgi:hypothetical protein
MIYELDVAHRELRTLKDHYYEMEKCLRAEIRNEYKQKIDNQSTMIDKQKNDFFAFRNETAKELKEEVAIEISHID